MSPADENKCIELTSNFYATVADSFSSTRQDPWEGWNKALSAVELPSSATVLDLACGNLRFEEFLEHEGVDVKHAICIDNCPALYEKSNLEVDYIECDIFKKLPDLSQKADLSVCFGFMHHVPSTEKRLEILGYLLSNTTLGGYVVVSFWQFLKDERLAKKSALATKEICEHHSIHFDNDNDRFLHWKDDTTVARYCHNFPDEEIGALLQSFSESVEAVDSYYEDGKRANLNRYVVLRKTA